MGARMSWETIFTAAGIGDDDVRKVAPARVTTEGGNLILGDGQGVGANQDGGDVILAPGTPAGSGTGVNRGPGGDVIMTTGSASGVGTDGNVGINDSAFTEYIFMEIIQAAGTDDMYGVIMEYEISSY